MARRWCLAPRATGRTTCTCCGPAAAKPEQLTNDLFDDVQPVFLPGGQGMVFSSNRYLDSAGRARPATFHNVVNNYDLFVYHLDGRAQPVETLVSTISNESRPRAMSDDGDFVPGRRKRRARPVPLLAENQAAHGR